MIWRKGSIIGDLYSSFESVTSTKGSTAMDGTACISGGREVFLATHNRVLETLPCRGCGARKVSMNRCEYCGGW